MVPDDTPRPRAYGAGRTSGVYLRCTPEWKGWLDLLTDRTGAGPTELIETALREWAEARGLPRPPQR